MDVVHLISDIVNYVLNQLKRRKFRILQEK